MDALSIQDRHSGRSITIQPPRDAYVTPDDVAAIEDATRKWVDPTTEDAAVRDLELLAEGRPERVLYGLMWLTGLWCTLCHGRLGAPLDEVVDGLDYRGLRRELSGIDDAAWGTGAQIIRRGVTSVLADDDSFAGFVGALSRLDPAYCRTRWQLMTIMDGLSQDMERNDLAPWGAARHLATAAGWTG